MAVEKKGDGRLRRYIRNDGKGCTKIKATAEGKQLVLNVIVQRILREYFNVFKAVLLFEGYSVEWVY